MKIVLLLLGKTTTRYLNDGIDYYVDRLRHYCKFEIKILPDIKQNKSLTQQQQKEMEGKLILQSVEKSDCLILLDERGKELTSRGFSELIERRAVASTQTLIFAVGGPYGFADDVYARADSLLSFSKMTFSHEMIRLFFVEQLYRAHTILRNEPYHHD